MPKRKVTDEARDQVARGLSVRGASERAVNQLWNLWHAEDEQIARGSFQRIVDKELQPGKEATINVAFPTYEGGQVVLPIVDLKPTLQRMAHESPAFTKALARALLGTGVLTPIFFAMSARQETYCLWKNCARQTYGTCPGCSAGITSKALRCGLLSASCNQHVCKAAPQSWEVAQQS